MGVIAIDYRLMTNEIDYFLSIDAQSLQKWWCDIIILKKWGPRMWPLQGRRGGGGGGGGEVYSTTSWSVPHAFHARKVSRFNKKCGNKNFAKKKFRKKVWKTNFRNKILEKKKFEIKIFITKMYNKSVMRSEFSNFVIQKNLKIILKMSRTPILHNNNFEMLLADRLKKAIIR